MKIIKVLVGLMWLVFWLSVSVALLKYSAETPGWTQMFLPVILFGLVTAHFIGIFLLGNVIEVLCKFLRRPLKNN